MTRAALSLAPPSREPADPSDFPQLRVRLASAGAGAREDVIAAFLGDDLREVGATLRSLVEYVGEVERTLADGRAGGRDLLELALSGPAAGLGYLEDTIAALRRRLAQVAVALPA